MTASRSLTAAGTGLSTPPTSRPAAIGPPLVLLLLQSARGGPPFQEVREVVAAGMKTLRQSALRKLADGITTFEEVVRVTAL